MNCNAIRSRLNEYLDRTVTLPVRAEIEAHLMICSSCQLELQARQELLLRLRKLPVPPVRPGFRKQVFKHARKADKKNHFGFIVGFSSAVTAGLLIWLITTFWLDQDSPEALLMPSVVLTVEQPSDLRLVFNANDDLLQVGFTLLLPPGVVMEGFPPQHEITWQDRLVKGRNVLNLSLVASQGVSGEIIAMISHEGRERLFRIPFRSVLRRAGNLPSRGKASIFI
ncbi:MAG: zf-HC2 domain-containing protein [Candidatus Thiodiazotropha sp. (ex Codakia rugifera)]|nr:zf-HC2 domain-containing protein [Candidatus Thiodiazotropha sp. (ex Codakia rugifera)]